MVSIYLLIPLSLMLFVIAIWAVHYAVKSNQFEDLDSASQRIILEDRQERRQALQPRPIKQSSIDSQSSTPSNTSNTSNSQLTENTDNPSI